MYGAFLAEEHPEVVTRCVRALCDAVAIPITAKMRLHACTAATLAAARRLQEAGIQALTVHGRTRWHIRRHVGVHAADWAAIRAVVAELDIPVIANGGVADAVELSACADRTGAAAVLAKARRD